MSDPNNGFVSVQPNNSSLIEESLEFAWCEIIKSHACPYPNLKHPLLTDESFVALLAGERGVTDWQPKDTLESQRKTADRAFDIHRKAGTRFGLVQALKALEFESEISRGTKPYSIDVVSYSKQSPPSDETLKRVSDRLTHYKSERDVFTVGIGALTDGGFFVGGGAVVSPTIVVGPWVPPSVDAFGHVYVGGALVSAMRVTVNEHI